MKLRMRMPGGSAPVEMEPEDTTELGLFMFLLEAQLNVPVHQLQLLTGFPPKPVDAELCAPLSSFLRNGDTVIVKQLTGEANIKRGATDGKYVPPASEKSCLVRRVVPGDNSCLFHAAAYVLENKSRTLGPSLRSKIAEVVLAHPKKFTTAFLGQPTAQYASWIQNPDTWGGAIELYILSFLYQTEIIALDLESNRLDRFGEEENYQVRCFVLYTGKHYDAMAMAPGFNMASESSDQVLFNPRDTRVLQRAVDWVKNGCR